MASIAPRGGGLSEDVPSGSNRWVVDKDSISTDSVGSPEIEVGGMLWELWLCKEDPDSDFCAYLCLVDGANYDVSGVDVAYEFKLINHYDEDNTICKKGTDTLEKNTMCGNSLADWSDVIDEGKGFIKENKLTLQCDFSLTDIRGFRKIHRIDFTDSNEPFHDIALIIEGEKIYVSTQFLSIHSPVFTSMFFGEFAEKGKNEVELNDVNRKDFIELLYVIYPPYKKITDDNFWYLLKLGDRFEINVIVNQCEQYLVTTDQLDVAGKLCYAGQYRLIYLQNHCLGKLRTSEQVQDLKNSPFFAEFTAEINHALSQKLISFTPSPTHSPSDHPKRSRSPMINHLRNLDAL